MIIPRTADTLPPRVVKTRGRGRSTTVLIALATLVGALGSTGLSVAGAQGAPTRARSVQPHLAYPVGTPDPTQPSGEGLPSATALPGYTLSYETDFPGTTLPAGWDVFTGIPGGDPGGHFGASHVVVGGGLLQLNTYRDPQWGNRWVTGG